jgi:hypothetical protein
LFISGFAGFLPVVSGVLMDNWLIINTIHFCRLYAIAGSFCGEERHTLGVCGGVNDVECWCTEK